MRTCAADDLEYNKLGRQEKRLPHAGQRRKGERRMDQSERRLFLIRSLLSEKKEYRDIGIPAEPDGQRQLLRGLMNVRAPQRAEQELLNG